MMTKTERITGIPWSKGPTYITPPPQPDNIQSLRRCLMDCEGVLEQWMLAKGMDPTNPEDCSDALHLTSHAYRVAYGVKPGDRVSALLTEIQWLRRERDEAWADNIALRNEIALCNEGVGRTRTTVESSQAETDIGDQDGELTSQMRREQVATDLKLARKWIDHSLENKSLPMLENALINVIVAVEAINENGQ